MRWFAVLLFLGSCHEQASPQSVAAPAQTLASTSAGSSPPRMEHPLSEEPATDREATSSNEVAASSESPSPLVGEPGSGVVIERHVLPARSSTGAGDRTLTMVRVDLERFEFEFFSSGDRGRSLPQWIRRENLVGGINAGMFMPDGRSVGFMMQDDRVLSNRRPSRFEGAIGLLPRSPSSSAISLGGPGCGPPAQRLRDSYRSVLQTRRVLIDCRGRARAWRTARYSMAAFGQDTEGRAVLVHSRTPYRMGRLSRMLVSMDLGIRGLLYMEGGPEASLLVRRPGRRALVSEQGSWEDGFNPNDRNRAFWDLPNIIGFRAK